MGKQINFYIENELQEKFIQQSFDQGFTILAEDLDSKKLVILNQLCDINPKIYTMYLYKVDFGGLVFDKDYKYKLDYLRSPVIEFTRNLIKPEKKIITRGRLWMESKYYNQNGEQVSKDINLTIEYDLLVRWLKKRVPFQEVSNGNYIIKEYVTNNIKEKVTSGFRLM